MRIKSRDGIEARKSRIKREICRAHELGPLPDPVCCAHCPDYRPPRACHPYCNFAPQRLSSEGDGSPLEAAVAPLVFELKRLGVFYPCWSCEGHNNSAGELRTIPRV